MEPVVLLFSYGSNNVEQLSQRVKRVTPFQVSPAYIENYTRIFAGYSRRWNGGVASLYPAKGMRTYGSLVEISTQELDELDKYEQGYTRIIMPVYCLEKQGPQNAFVYVKNNPVITHLPSESYMRSIRKQLIDARYQREKIVIRGVSLRGALSTFATWDPNHGMIIKKDVPGKKK